MRGKERTKERGEIVKASVLGHVPFRPMTICSSSAIFLYASLFHVSVFRLFFPNRRHVASSSCSRSYARSIHAAIPQHLPWKTIVKGSVTSLGGAVAIMLGRFNVENSRAVTRRDQRQRVVEREKEVREER